MERLALKFSDYRLSVACTLQVSEIDSDHLALIDIPSNAAEKSRTLICQPYFDRSSVYA